MFEDQKASQKQIRYLNYLIDLIKTNIDKFEDKDGILKILNEINLDNITKNDASDYIETLKSFTDTLKENHQLTTEKIEKTEKPVEHSFSPKEKHIEKHIQIIKVKCLECGEITNFIGTEENLKNHWKCLCGSKKYQIISKERLVIMV